MVINDKEYLARFISNEGWFNQGQVKGDAFRPQKNRHYNDRLETSVSRHDGQNLEKIKEMGGKWKSRLRSKPVDLLGWADVMVGAVRTISTIPSLEIEAAPSAVNPNHANIIGWNLQEGQSMIQAEEIARQSKLNLI